jgi:hypothetical protein
MHLQKRITELHMGPHSSICPRVAICLGAPISGPSSRPDCRSKILVAAKVFEGTAVQLSGRQAGPLQPVGRPSAHDQAFCGHLAHLRPSHLQPTLQAAEVARGRTLLLNE